MSTQQELRRSINELIRSQLERSHCVRGHLRYPASDGGPGMAFSGWREDNQAVQITEPHRQLGVLLSQYAEDFGGVSIEANLERNSFEYAALNG